LKAWKLFAIGGVVMQARIAPACPLS